MKQIVLLILVILFVMGCSDYDLFAISDSCSSIHRFKNDTTFVTIKTRYEHWDMEYDIQKNAVEKVLLTFTQSGKILKSKILAKNDSINYSPWISVGADYKIHSANDSIVLLSENSSVLFLYNDVSSELSVLPFNIQKGTFATFLTPNTIGYTANDSLYTYDIRTNEISPLGLKGFVVENASQDTGNCYLYQKAQTLQIFQYNLFEQRIIDTLFISGEQNCERITLSEKTLLLHIRVPKNSYFELDSIGTHIYPKDSSYTFVTELPYSDVTPFNLGTQLLAKNREVELDTFTIYDSWLPYITKRPLMLY